LTSLALLTAWRQVLKDDHITGIIPASIKNIIKNVSTTGTVLPNPALPPPANQASYHRPDITESDAGMINIVSMKNKPKARPADAWMNLAKAPSNLCFCHLDPSCTIQNIRKNKTTADQNATPISKYIE
jgi:hypothetical protein